MAANGAAYIDLTFDSDAEETIHLPFPPLGSIHSQSRPIDFVSHNGLPKIEPHAKQHKRPAAILPPQPQIRPAQRAGLLKPNHILAFFHRSPAPRLNGSPNSNKLLVEQAENPAKRRKTQGEMMPHSTTPIPAPRPFKSIVPANSLKRVRSPLPKTIISGASRAEYSQLPRVPAEGSTPKSRLTMIEHSHSSPALGSSVKRVPRPGNLLGPHQDPLPDGERRPAGKKAVKTPVLNSKSRNEGSDYNEALGKTSEDRSPGYELHAQAYRVHTSALGRLTNEARPAPTSVRSDNASSSSKPELNHLSSPSLLLSKSHASRSLEQGDIWEDDASTPLSTVPQYSNISRAYSSSPTTSFSNEHPDGEKIENTNISQVLLPSSGRTQKLRRSSRTTQLHGKSPQMRGAAISSISKLPGSSKASRSAPKNPALNVEVQHTDVKLLQNTHDLLIAAKDTSIDRPYLTYRDREDIARGIETSSRSVGQTLSYFERQTLELSALHVDFSLEEMRILYVVIMTVQEEEVSKFPSNFDLPRKIISIMANIQGRHSVLSKIKRKLKDTIASPFIDRGIALLRTRSDAAVANFLQDAIEGRIVPTPHVVRLAAKPVSKSSPRKSRLSALLMQREIHGMTPHRLRNGQESFRVMATNHVEDSAARKSEFTDCCGDISSIAWTGKHGFVCGTTAHSDLHNMQYNKPGNLVLGSTSHDTLRAVSNHRIKRPSVVASENAENSLAAMRETQSPWLYTSVVSTAYNATSGFTFTASFDETVKVWKVTEDGAKMDLRGAWYHDGKVNFVVTSDYHDRVATASDVPHDAIRVYNLEHDDPTQSEFASYGGNRAQEQGVEEELRERWAYFPATVQWGKAYNVSHLLLVGYSPRSLTAHETDIPEDKQNTGELCLWNVENGTKVVISSAKTQNVFEVMWHPTQPIFAAATSPTGNFEPSKTKTQIRLFAQANTGVFFHIKVLDCPAMDVNELTIMPHSMIHSYVTASCTDGKTYVYDTAHSEDIAIHILKHGESLDNPIHDLPRELADTGVKFAAWGQSTNRFYTGASDGKVKVWDITAPPKQAFVRDMLSVTGGISAGAFSKDYSHLVIGDATGKVHVLGMDDSDLEDNPVQTKARLPPPGRQVLQRGGIMPPGFKRPKVLIQHLEPPPPVGHSANAEIEESGQTLAREYIENGQISIVADASIGAVQGVNYPEIDMYHTEAHEGHDGLAPLLPAWQAKQQSELQRRKTAELHLPTLPSIASSNLVAHMKNLALDLHVNRLPPETLYALKQDNVEFRWESRCNFKLEISPSRAFEIFKEDTDTRIERKKWEKEIKKS